MNLSLIFTLLLADFQLQEPGLIKHRLNQEPKLGAKRGKKTAENPPMLKKRNVFSVVLCFVLNEQSSFRSLFSPELSLFPDEMKKMSLMWQYPRAANEESDLVLIATSSFLNQAIGGRVFFVYRNCWAVSPLMSGQTINTDINCSLLYSTGQGILYCLIWP